MCIRDSGNGSVGKNAAAKGSDDPVADEQFFHKKPAGRLRVCLLYTSDAADDLPCVDLGGRRII